METALQLLLDRIYSTADEGMPTLLISLDMSAAFDTIDHTVLLKRLSYSFGVAGNVHSWIHSYLTGRTQSVCIGSHSSLPTHALLVSLTGLSSAHYFFLYTLLPLLTHTKSVSSNTRTTRNCMWLCLSPINYYHDISALQSCLTSLQAWFCESSMALNPSKSVAILFGTPQRLKSVSDLKCITVLQPFHSPIR